MSLIELNYDVIDNILNFLNIKEKIYLISSSKDISNHYNYIIKKYLINKWLYNNDNKFCDCLHNNIYTINLFQTIY